MIWPKVGIRSTSCHSGIFVSDYSHKIRAVEGEVVLTGASSPNTIESDFGLFNKILRELACEYQLMLWR